MFYQMTLQLPKRVAKELLSVHNNLSGVFMNL